MNQYLTYTRDALITALARITTDIISTHEHLAFQRSEDLRARRDAWESYPNESISAREKLASVASTETRIAVLVAESELARLTEEKFFLRFLIDNGTSQH